MRGVGGSTGCPEWLGASEAEFSKSSRERTYQPAKKSQKKPAGCVSGRVRGGSAGTLATRLAGIDRMGVTAP